MTFPTCFQKFLWSESYWVVPETLDVLSGAENELRVNRYQISLCKVPVCRSPIAQGTVRDISSNNLSAKLAWHPESYERFRANWNGREIELRYLEDIKQEQMWNMLRRDGTTGDSGEFSRHNASVMARIPSATSQPLPDKNKAAAHISLRWDYLCSTR